MEAICIGVFTIEFVARVVSTPDINNYFKDFMNVIDVIAIVPFYLEVYIPAALSTLNSHHNRLLPRAERREPAARMRAGFHNGRNDSLVAYTPCRLVSSCVSATPSLHRSISSAHSLAGFRRGKVD
jgi:hypothetical protein